ncbi:MAG: PDZ domain-containing protein [Bacteroidia bacterium]
MELQKTKPADKAGIKAGDIVTKNGRPASQRHDGCHMQALSVFKRGQEIDVIIIREGKELRFVKVKF